SLTSKVGKTEAMPNRMERNIAPQVWSFYKLVPGQIDELKDSLEVIDSRTMERVHDSLMHRLTGFLL
ncbi:unnamed protein product, partial [marine sediment metagenome]